MMKITTYTEWKQAVNAEYKKLREVHDYLNEKGKKRYLAFATLDNLTYFLETAEEMLDQIERKEGLNRYEMEALEGFDAALPIKALRRLVKQKEQ